ncbi:MAG TPA: LuxR C-terminal-related transcriptional regulator [Anaerolineales bacterium]|nr:LuxR C-terminal-related transcriptional regulator [Anaerolineales bacterium]
MPITLLSTKLHIPRPRAHPVSRPRLTEKLLAALSGAGGLVLTSAPAGFGKTTLLAEFAADLPQQAAWLSLDQADNDPIRFWTYLITACQSAQRMIGEAGLSLLQMPQPLPAETIPTLLINDLVRLGTKLALVLDDYHAIQNPDIHAGLIFLLDHLPDNLHVILSTRVDPPWPLARLRARGQLTEIRAGDLRFTTEEAAAFLSQVMNLHLSAQHVAALESRTEGWVASLQLAAISMKGRSDVEEFVNAFTGSHLFVAEYLIEEVLEHQPEHVRLFLLQTSILERLHSDLCNAVSGLGDSQPMLRDLYQANLFLVPLDDEGQWYRYHRLFADLLQARLHQACSAEEITNLHQRAKRWFEQNGFVGEAIHHALVAGDFKSAAHLVERNAAQLITRGELTTIMLWIEQLPDDLILHHPPILLAKAWVLVLAGDVRPVEALLQQAEAQIGAHDTSRAALEVLGNAAAIRAFITMMMGEYSRALELAERADRLLPETQVHGRWLLPYTIGAAHRGAGQYEEAAHAFARQAQMGETYNNLIIWATGITEVAIMRRLQGRLREASDTCLRALQKIEERAASKFGSLAKLEVPLIEVLREQNKLEEASRRITDVIDRMQNWPMPTDRIFAGLAQIRLLDAQGDLEGAFRTLQAAKELKARHPVLMNLARSVDFSEVRLHLKTGEVDTAARLLDQLQPGTSRAVSTREQELILLARVRLAQGRPEDAEKILSSLVSEAEAGNRDGALIEILAFEACVPRADGDMATAYESLTKALTLAEPEGFVRVFVDEGEAMQQMLVEVAHRLKVSTDEVSIRLRGYVAKLLEAFPKGRTPAVVYEPSDKASALIEPLTPRELEVLHLIAAGHSNQAIADQLVITLSAVKKHTGNIFGKLNVNSRTQAVARARELGLFSSQR